MHLYDRKPIYLLHRGIKQLSSAFGGPLLKSVQAHAFIHHMCHISLLALQFAGGGCENCGFLGMEGDKDRCLECTTVAFQGMVSVIDPASSWCAKWLHLCKFLFSLPLKTIPKHSKRSSYSLDTVKSQRNNAHIALKPLPMSNDGCLLCFGAAKLVPGCYALSVQVEVPPDIKELMAENGRRVLEAG